MTDEDAVVALLTARGAPAVEHPGGNLRHHLIRTGETLRRWGAPRELVVAGLAHAAYGTDGFDVALFSLAERDVVAAAIGESAEAIVYRYASCDRAVTLPRVDHAVEVPFRDRFTGVVTTLAPTELTQFAELTVANELDLVGHSETFRREHGAALAALFAPWKHVVSAQAYDAYRRLLGSTAHASSG